MSNEDSQKPTSRRQIARLIGSSPLPFYVLSEEDVVVFANEATGHHFSIDAEKLIGINCNPTAKNISEWNAKLGLPIDWNRQQIRLLADADGKTVRILLPIETSGAEGRATVMVVIVPDLHVESMRQLDWNGVSVRKKMQELFSQFGPESPWYLTGPSPQTQFLRQQVQLACKNQFPIAIVGNEGAYREELAVWIHRARRQICAGVASTSPIVIDCPLMDHSLLSGMFELIAERRSSTPSDLAVVLKDLDRLPTDLTVPLASFLAKNPQIDLYATLVRISHSSHSPNSSFLPQELFNRIGSFIIPIPFLADRKEDLQELVNAWFIHNQRRILSELRDETKRVPSEFQSTLEFFEALEAYPWKGDLSELAHALAHAFQQSNGKPLRAAHLPISLRTSNSELEETKSFSIIDLDSVLEETEKHLTLGALEHAKGNRSAAAKLLNVSRARLIRRLQQWGLDKEQTEIIDDDLPKFEEIE